MDAERKGHVRTQGEKAICKPRREAAEKPALLTL